MLHGITAGTHSPLLVYLSVCLLLSWPLSVIVVAPLALLRCRGPCIVPVLSWSLCCVYTIRGITAGAPFTSSLPPSVTRHRRAAAAEDFRNPLLFLALAEASDNDTTEVMKVFWE